MGPQDRYRSEWPQVVPQVGPVIESVHHTEWKSSERPNSRIYNLGWGNSDTGISNLRIDGKYRCAKIV
eukprot:8242-Eustigmatos_ZCMA.PRE.1